MGHEEMLAEVRRLKDNCVSAMIAGDAAARRKAEAAAKTFLTDNFAQILDIVDDALTDRR